MRYCSRYPRALLQKPKVSSCVRLFLAPFQQPPEGSYCIFQLFDISHLRGRPGLLKRHWSAAVLAPPAQAVWPPPRPTSLASARRSDPELLCLLHRHTIQATCSFTVIPNVGAQVCMGDKQQKENHSPTRNIRMCTTNRNGVCSIREAHSYSIAIKQRGATSRAGCPLERRLLLS